MVVVLLLLLLVMMMMMVMTMMIMPKWQSQTTVSLLLPSSFIPALPHCRFACEQADALCTIKGSFEL